MTLTREDAEKVARLIGYADGGCYYCAANLAEIAEKVFPEWRFVVGSSVEEVDDDPADPIESLPGGWPNKRRVEVAVETAAVSR